MCGYLLDLRGNTGGNAFPMLVAVAPLLPPKIDVQASYLNGQLFVQVTLLVRVCAPAHARPRAPVAVLTDGQTASSGEGVLLDFTGRRNLRSFGQPTYGFTMGNHEVRLSDGAWLYVTRGHGRPARPPVRWERPA